MNRKQKIQSLLNRLGEIEKERALPLPEFVGKMIDDDASSAQERTRNSPTSRAIKRLARDLDDVKKDPRIDGILKSLKKADSANKKGFESISADFAEKLASLSDELAESEKRGNTMSSEGIRSIHERMLSFREEYDFERGENDKKSSSLAKEVENVRKELTSLLDDVRTDLGRTSQEMAPVGSIASEALSTATEAQKAATEANDAIEELRKRVNSRVGSPGGNMNRNIAIGGNQQALSPFTDINLKAGSNVTITYAANQATGFMDVTIAATGGGGGSGITRQVSSIAISTAAGSATGIDYVYLASGTLTVTLPTSVGNSNLYTIKNIGAGIVTVNTTGGETIEGDPTLTMPLQFTSVDLISNNSGNWNIT